MDSMIRYFVGMSFIYFALNWVADNPKTINELRTLINGIVAEMTHPDAN